MLAFIVNQKKGKKEKISRLRKADDNIQILELAKSRNNKQIENKTKIWIEKYSFEPETRLKIKLKSSRKNLGQLIHDHIWHSLVNLHICLNMSSCYSSIPLVLGLIGREGGFSTLYHSCGLACQQRVLKTFPGPGYLHICNCVARSNINTILPSYIKILQDWINSLKKKFSIICFCGTEIKKLIYYLPFIIIKYLHQ